jgi:hypothetical protein
MWVSTENTIKEFWQLLKLQFSKPLHKYQCKKRTRLCKLWKDSSGRLTVFATLKLEDSAKKKHGATF